MRTRADGRGCTEPWFPGIVAGAARLYVSRSGLCGESSRRGAWHRARRRTRHSRVTILRNRFRLERISFVDLHAGLYAEKSRQYFSVIAAEQASCHFAT